MEPPLPDPIYVGKQRRWKLSKVLAYERELAGEPPLDHLEPVDERWLTAAQMRERFGNVSDMWLWRRGRGRSRRPQSAHSG